MKDDAELLSLATDGEFLLFQVDVLTIEMSELRDPESSRKKQLEYRPVT
jgi:hypothetical protein